MAQLRIEMDRQDGRGWVARSEGEIPDATPAERIQAEVDRFCLQYPHRAVLNGQVVYEGKPQIKRRAR